MLYHDPQLNTRCFHQGDDQGPATYPKGRICEAPGCDTVLSIYNAFHLCWQCDQRAERHALEHLVAGVIEDIIEGDRLPLYQQQAGLALARMAA